ncbi:MAG: amidohydrolase family protein [Planctomycetota bacterium]
MILRAAWVLPVVGPPIRDGYVQVLGDRIVAVGPADMRSGPRPTVPNPQPPAPIPQSPAPGRRSAESVPFVDLGQAILTPGLVNPHAHLELTGYAGRLGPGSFWSWLPRLVELRREPGQIEREQDAVEAGAWDSLRAGVTCVGDISRRNLAWPVLKRLRIRKVCFVELLTLADHPPRDPDELRRAAAEVEEDALLSVGVSPHTPFTVPAEQVRGAIQLAAELRRPWCTHWAETREECAFLRGESAALPEYLRELMMQCGVRSPGQSPLDLLETCVAGANPGAVVHANYLEGGDAARLAAAGHVLVYCPRAHRFFGHAPHPYRAWQEAGVTVALGTDSAASNENLCLLEEARFVARQTPDPPPAETLLRMVTLDAARALRLADRVGSLEPGKQADVAAFPCSPTTDDPIGELVRRAPRPTHVWVAGRQVF